MVQIVDETDGAGAGGSTDRPAGASAAGEADRGPAAADSGEPGETPEARELPAGDAAAGSTSAGAAADAAAPDSIAEPESPSAAEATTPTPRKRRIAVVLICAALALGIDVVSKAVVVAQLQDRAPIHVPGGFLILNLIRNSGAAFSIGEGQTWLFTLIAAAVVFVILRVSRNLRSLPWAVALGMLLGGALGNLSDRLFRSPGIGRGDVVDFLQFPTFPLVHYDFPVFNLADTSIVVGGCLMVLLSFLGIQPDGTRHKGG